MCRAVRLMPLIAAISFWSVLGPTARAEEDDTATLAAALKTAKATLQDGLRASKARGTPISAKFEIEDGKLQLSIYTMKGNDFVEVVADPKAGAIAYAQEITDAMDLNEAIEQQAAVAKAKVPLLAAADTAVNENAGSRAVSIVPELKIGQATAEVTCMGVFLSSGFLVVTGSLFGAERRFLVPSPAIRFAERAERCQGTEMLAQLSGLPLSVACVFAAP